MLGTEAMPFRRLAVPLCFTPKSGAISCAIRIHTAAPITVGIRPTLPESLSARIGISRAHFRIRSTCAAFSFAALSVTHFPFGILPILDDLFHYTQNAPFCQEGIPLFFLHSIIFSAFRQNSKNINKKIAQLPKFFRSVHDIFINWCYNVQCKFVRFRQIAI